MTPDVVHCLVARCLTDPAFLQRARDRCGATAKAGPHDAEDEAAALIGPAELDRLMRFRGFITKVKHNALRRRIPGTLGLMGALGIELAFFQAFSPAYVTARRAGPLSTEDHLALFANELASYLAGASERQRALVAETFDHERTLYELAKADGAPPLQAAGRVRWRGSLRLARRSFDVTHLCAQLAARRFDLARDVVERDHVLGYWSVATCQGVALFEVDTLTAVLFSMLRQQTSPEEVVSELTAHGLQRLSVADVKGFAADAADRGFIELSGDWAA